MATAVEILTEARRILAEGQWCQGYYARDAGGEQCSVNGHQAVSMCMEGAVMRARRLLNNPGPDRAMELLGRAVPKSPDPSLGAVVIFNDTHERTKDEVLAAFDRAIELAKSAP